MLNMPDAHYSKGVNTNICHRTVERLTSKGLIDTLGHEMHLNRARMYVDADDITETVKSYQKYGVSQAVTEFTISLDAFPHMSRAERFAEQAKVAEAQLGAVRKAGVKDITFWGDTDIPNEPWMQEAHPWDSNRNPKPFYYAVRRVVRDAVVAR